MTERFIKLTSDYSDVFEQDTQGSASENQLLDLEMIIDSLDGIDDKTHQFINANTNTNKTKEFLIELSHLLINDGKPDLAKDFFEDLLDHELPEELKSQIFLILSNIAIHKCNWKEVVNQLRDAKLSFNKENNRVGEAKVQNLSGIYFGEQGNIIGAKQQFLEGLQLLDGLPVSKLQADLVINLAITEIICENYKQAEEYFDQVVRILNKLGDNTRITHLNYNYGMLYLHKKDYISSLEMFEKSIGLAEENMQQDILAMSYLGKAQVLIHSGFILDGKEELLKAVKIAETIEDNLTIADIFKVKGIIERIDKNYRESEKLLLKSYKLNEDLGNRLNSAECAYELGILYDEIGREFNKYNWFDIALKYFRQIKAQSKVEFIEKHLEENQTG